jgi:hypothetical protein
MTAYVPDDETTVREWADKFDAECPQDAGAALASLVEAAHLLGGYHGDDSATYYGAQALAEVALWFDFVDSKETRIEHDGEHITVKRRDAMPEDRR